MREFEDATYDYGLDPGESFEPDELEDEPFDRAQPHVMTALGPIDPGALGFTLPHEHVVRQPTDADPDLVLDDPAVALAELESYFLTGGRTIVDLTTADAGRDMTGIIWVAARAPVHLVLATGHHRDEDAAPIAGEQNADELAEQFIRELSVGIDGTEAMAGVIAVDFGHDRITPAEERVLRAAARAHLTTGAPVTTSSLRGAMALEQLAILSDEGVNPARVVFGGLDAGLDEGYLRAVLETGAFAMFDRWSRTQDAPDEARAALVKRLIDADHGMQLLISGNLGRKSSWLAYGGPGFVYFLERVPLQLMEAGLTALQVRDIFIENPARALTVAPPH
jgi:phosphotriesterase-related protein